jgi:hypothetical protein
LEGRIPDEEAERDDMHVAESPGKEAVHTIKRFSHWKAKQKLSGFVNVGGANIGSRTLVKPPGK